MIGSDNDIGRVANTFLFERLESSSQIVIGVANGGEGLRRSRTEIMLGGVGIIHPQERESGNAILPQVLGQGPGGPIIASGCVQRIFWERTEGIRQFSDQVFRQGRSREDIGAVLGAGSSRAVG